MLRDCSVVLVGDVARMMYSGVGRLEKAQNKAPTDILDQEVAAHWLPYWKVSTSGQPSSDIDPYPCHAHGRDTGALSNQNTPHGIS